MLLKRWHLDGIVEGTIDLAFRRWERPRVKPGTRLRTQVGVLEVLSVEPVRRVTAAEARRAGYATVRALHEDIGADRPGSTYRVELRLAGPDPRLELRERLPDADELSMIITRLARLDAASKHGPWTASVLRTVAERPGVRAPELAASYGRETLPFKTDVRKLKELGLTESLAVGYRLSPRGAAVLAALERP